MNNFIDLHMHSIYSDDGEFSPEYLVKQCHENGIRIMSVTDHNSVRAVTEATVVAERLGITCLPGIEIDCTFTPHHPSVQEDAAKGINLHVLGYGIDYKRPMFKLLEDNIIRQETSCSMKKIELTNKLGFQLVKEDLDRFCTNGIYTGELFAEVLLQDERYLNSELLAPYRTGGDRSDNPYVNFYWDYYSQDKPCYTEIIYPTLEETISIIREHGGVAVLAHPGNNLKGQFEVFDDMIPLGLQGVEAFSNYHTPDTVAYFLDKGRKYNLLITCGSDYHGKTKPAIRLGQTRCTIEEAQIEEQLINFGLI